MDAEKGRWFQDVGRDKAANKPLLRIIFQTPLVLLSASLLEDTLEIWNNIPKPKDKQHASFHDYFVLDVVGLSHYQHAKDKFIEDVNELRKRFSSPSEASLQTKPLVPAVDFVRSTSEIWDRVVNDKALDIPSHKVMIAKVRCEQIDNDKFDGFIVNEEWSQLKVAVNNPPVSCFGIKVTSMVDKCLAEYEEEAEFYDEVVKADHREKLKQRLLQEIKPILGSLMDNISSQALEAFKFNLDQDLNGGKIFREAADWSKLLVKFDSDYKDSKIEQSEWTSTKVRDKLVSQINSHVDSIRSMKKNELTNHVKLKIESGLTESMGAILNKPGNSMWVNLRELFRRETDSACSEFRVGLEKLGTNDTAKVEADEMLKDYGRDIIEKSVRKETYKILQLLQDKFCYILLNEPDSSIPRSWKGSDKIQVIVKTARVECVNIMAVMAIMRMDINKESDDIQQILHNALLEGGGEGSLSSNNWNGVEASKTLMSPAACATIWDQFLKSSGIIITTVNQTIQARNDADKVAAVNNQGLQDNSNVTVEESVAMFLLVLGHGVKLRVLGGIYIRSLETISRRFHEVLRLVLSLSKDFIRLPNQVENVDENDHKWRWFKDCLGALDGTHVEMIIPLKDQGRYRNRKQQITTNVLGVCDRKSLKFLYVLPGWEGSSSDSKVLRSALVRERDPFLVPTGIVHIINACCVLHNYIRKIASELDYPLLHEVDCDLAQQSNEVFDVDYEDVITNVQGGSQWTNFRDDMAREMYSQYQVRSGRT
ncbi:protein ROOT HAIR DEFECTIVE 3 homolog 1-like [Impatiens glandulifera]|uniref:protein ROOT HAIR DEFECTIVE 3 homolog 1-like n=1 Tax=Impatiens glandulifera TaxID=253017 RepID=UPI001FB06A9E|nr:protein ROOT HAIR DEFECTIVE 3 homolog 1-like [Impatiens glandulifera]